MIGREGTAKDAGGNPLDADPSGSAEVPEVSGELRKWASIRSELVGKCGPSASPR
jgi:hypothetical protein